MNQMVGVVAVAVVAAGLVTAIAVVAALGLRYLLRRRQGDRELDDARAEAARWYERLGGQVFHLSGEEPTVRQALADASERYVAAGSQIGQARTVRQFQLARETALEGLMYVQAARRALGMDEGPDLPRLAAASEAGALTQRREAEVDGHIYRAGPDRSGDTPYYYPGGRVRGRRVPAGWYSTPLWNPATAGVAGATASAVVLSSLVGPPFIDVGYDVPDAVTGTGTDQVSHGPAELRDPDDVGGGFADVGGFSGFGGDGGGDG
jgi:hypothetical protein